MEFSEKISFKKRLSLFPQQSIKNYQKQETKTYNIQEQKQQSQRKTLFLNS